ncbi:ornithine cyclodeaminase family protein [Couchioplanes azureus]|uniref:ornithine cyclodeaminase family protein n=1 Tax=Couchioplanes caeruleus TaxID=56438 RepID=UPI0019A84626|nr:ornithine cyclodeaminase family protein [Couchioplanes caeruleus]GGQ76091.1 ornithine cyclodeaminase [Couchioplanes caeruleus subsp. azureus]
MSASLPYHPDPRLGRLSMDAAVAAVEAAVGGDLDPEREPARSAVPAQGGHLLTMPSVGDRYVGVKLVSVASGNPAHGLPRIQGLYILFDAATLSPLSIMDGTQLTALRTPAVSAVAARHLAAAEAQRLLLFGTGPQAHGHVEALRRVLPLTRIEVAGRRPEAVDAFVAHWRDRGVEIAPATAGSVSRADVVCCCTDAREPLFAGTDVAAHALVIAVGSHTPDARELDAALFARGTTVVESRATALREAGDVIQALAEGAVEEKDLVTLQQVVRGPGRPPVTRPRIFKSTGMAWQDLAVAVAAYEHEA